MFTRIVQWLLITLVLIVVAVWVWPTRYRYDHASFGTMTVPVRFDRFTGRAELFSPMGKTWVRGRD